MTLRRLAPLSVGFMFIIWALAVALTPDLLCAAPKSDVLGSCPADMSTAVRVFWNPPDGGYFHFPLIFRTVKQTDSRLNSAPMTDEGRIAYISLGEMSQLIQALAHLDLAWEHLGRAEDLGNYRDLQPENEMEILVICSKGRAKAMLSAKRICVTLKPLDEMLKTPRALWEFQLFRQGYGCKVSGFNQQAFPDHQ